ncbi:chorismate--pyruvate lyase family protein [Vibrio maerlii]|uniref:chorismate--pyruvate lyase family protein n=1 Tax=Vibrio maerlii TaxID=2231648 RepID=UPI0019D0E6B8|nr:chorismate lyase [Vibrio maerlii]
MNQQYALYLDAIRKVKWQSPEDVELPNALAHAWLTEQGSLSRRLEKHCCVLSVSRMQQEMVSQLDLSTEEGERLPDEKCLQREVILCGDDQEWVLGRTLIPQSALKNQQHDFSTQGDIPLGNTIFSADQVRRDKLEFGFAQLDGRYLLARRSRLWMNDKPMLVAELFLPQAPIYQEEWNK